MWSGHAMTCLVASCASGGRGRCCRQQHRKSGVCSQASHSRSMCFGQNPHLQILKYGHQDSVLIYLMFPKVNTINSQEQCFLLLLDIRKITYSTQQKRKLDRTSNTWEFPFTCQPVDSNPRWKKYGLYERHYGALSQQLPFPGHLGTDQNATYHWLMESFQPYIGEGSLLWETQENVLRLSWEWVSILHAKLYI